MAGPRSAKVVLGYDVHGPADAPALVLGPSLGTIRDVWDPQLEPLSRHFKVIRYDHRGHGDSAVPPGPYTMPELAEDVLDLVDVLGIERFSYAGISLGGMIGMTLAATQPDRVERLALCFTSAHMPPAEGWLDRAARVRAGDTAAVTDAVVARWFTPSFAEREPVTHARYRAMLEGTLDEGYAGCCEAIASMDLRSLLPGITAPTLVIAGAEDAAAPPPHAEAIVEVVVSARLQVVPGAAHLGNVERAEECTALLLEHLTGQLTGRRMGKEQR